MCLERQQEVVIFRLATSQRRAFSASAPFPTTATPTHSWVARATGFQTTLAHKMMIMIILIMMMMMVTMMTILSICSVPWKQD